MEISHEKAASTAWQKSKWIVKGSITGGLALLMMVPMLYVKAWSWKGSTTAAGRP